MTLQYRGLVYSHSARSLTSVRHDDLNCSSDSSVQLISVFATIPETPTGRGHVSALNVIHVAAAQIYHGLAIQAPLCALNQKKALPLTTTAMPVMTTTESAWIHRRGLPGVMLAMEHLSNVVIWYLRALVVELLVLFPPMICGEGGH